MPISFSNLSGGGALVDTSQKWIRLAAANTTYWIDLQALVGSENDVAGFYRFSFLADSATTPTGSVILVSSSFSDSPSVGTIDRDTANGANYSELFISVSSTQIYAKVSSNNAGYMTVQKLDQKPGVFKTVTSYTSSQNVTISADSLAILIGGGGGGGSYSTDAGAIYGGGGGSGYLTSFSVAPGTYPLVVGAGGGGAGYPGTGGTGGTSSFAGQTALGGRGGSTVGGNGGSGGGGSQGAGGANGANGAGINPGTGSTVTLPGFITAGTSGSGGRQGGGGGTYAGGGGGYGYWGGASNAGGGAGYGIGGGGGSGGGEVSWNTGGSGAAGGLVIFGG